MSDEPTHEIINNRVYYQPLHNHHAYHDFLQAMRLEQQVCSLELSKKLKELGVRQESIWVWTNPWLKDRFVTLNDEWILTTEYLSTTLNDRDFISAFTAAELGEMLPLFETGRSGKRVQVRRYKGQSWCFQRQDDNTEANARAKMLVYLIEQGIVKI